MSIIKSVSDRGRWVTLSAYWDCPTTRSFSDFYSVGIYYAGVNQPIFYGVTFEIPLMLVERALGLEHSREISLMRHLLSHLFFLTGGFFAWLLARRMFSSPALALCAMLLFRGGGARLPRGRVFAGRNETHTRQRRRLRGRRAVDALFTSTAARWSISKNSARMTIRAGDSC